MTDDTARYLNTLESVFGFIFGELNLSEGNLQFGDLSSFEELNIKLANFRIVTCAQGFYGSI